MAETLSQLLDEQEETNYRLDELDDRFLNFFRQQARDRMDLMELLREQSGDGGAGGGGAPSPDSKPEETSGGGAGMFGFGALITTAAGLIAATFLNELGAVFIEKIPGALTKIGTSIKEFTKSIGDKFKTGITAAKTKVATAAGAFTERLKAFGNSMAERAGKVGGAIKSGAGVVGDKIKGVGSSVSNFFSNVKNVGAEKLSAIGSRVSDLKETAQVKGMMAMDAVKGSGAFQKMSAVGSKAAAVASPVMKVANRALAPLAAVTSGVSGYNMAQETPDMSTGGKLAVGAGGAASAFFGGFADFIKLVTVDAAIEAGQKMGILAEDGLAQAMQDQSVQRDVFDPMVRSARDMLTEGIANATTQAVGSNGSVVVLQNNNQKQSTQNSTVLGSGPQTSPTMGNGTRADASAYAAP